MAVVCAERIAGVRAEDIEAEADIARELQLLGGLGIHPQLPIVRLALGFRQDRVGADRGEARSRGGTRDFANVEARLVRAARSLGQLKPV